MRQDDDSSSSGDSSTAQNLSGSIAIDGSSTVQPFAEAAAELFNEDNPDVDITVGAAGTSGGFEKFCAGETDISDASRPIEPEEVDACKKEGDRVHRGPGRQRRHLDHRPTPALEICCLTTDQLSSCGPTTRSPTTASWATTPTPASRCPTPTSASTGPARTRGRSTTSPTQINGEEDASRKEYQPSEDDNVLVQGVAGDENGLGYFGFSYYEQNQDQLNLVSVDSGDGCVAPSTDTIQSGDYSPLSRPLFMYPKPESLQKPEVSGFMQFVVDSYSDIADAALIVPMDDTQAADAKSALDDALSSAGG